MAPIHDRHQWFIIYELYIGWFIIYELYIGLFSKVYTHLLLVIYGCYSYNNGDLIRWR